MKISTLVAEPDSLKASSIVRFCFSGAYTRDVMLKKFDRILGGSIKRIYDSGEFDGALNQTVILHTGSAIGFERIILAGLGEQKKADNDSYRQASGTISQLRAIKSSRTVTFCLNDKATGTTAAAVVEGFLLGSHKITDYKSDDADNKMPEELIFCANSKKESGEFSKGIYSGQIIAEGVLQARKLAADPANYLTPEKFARKAEFLAKKYKLESDILSEARIKSEKMGALLAVAQGSANPPRVVILKYSGRGTKDRPIVLIGKGITFDSGGISLKDPLDMYEMKGDMTGGAIVLAAVVTAARLRLKQNIVGIIPLAENMPSGTAIKPGDIVTSRKGKTIEVINTDCEGRLILADALDYANEYKPAAVVDIATLTGAAKYILGTAGIPIIGNSDKLIGQIKEASNICGELVWQLPIWDEHREMMKSSIADLKNSAGQYAGTIAASAFLENFVGDWPWAHLDIAYVDIEKVGRPYVPKGQTGTGFRLIVELLRNWKKV